MSSGIVRPSEVSSAQKVVWRYYAYRLTVNNGFFIPVGILYIEERGLGLDVVGATQGVFLLAVVAFQVPSGYLGDRLGTRNGLVVGSVAVTLTMVLYPFGHSLLTFSLLYVLWAFGWSFDTGAREAWLYEILERRSDSSEYARISGRGETALLLGSTITAATAGLLYTINPVVPFVANAVLTALGIPILLSLPAADTGTEDRFSISDAANALKLQVRRPDIRWFVLYIALFSVAFEITRAYEQPAAVDVGVPVAVLGLLFSGFKLVSAGASYAAGPLYERLGVRPVFFLMLPVAGVAYALILVVPWLVVIVFFVARSLGAITKPIQNQYFNDRLSETGRATVLSGVYMTTSFAGAVVHFIGGSLAPVVGSVRLILGAGVSLTVIAAVVWIATGPVRSGKEKR